MRPGRGKSPRNLRCFKGRVGFGVIGRAGAPMHFDEAWRLGFVVLEVDGLLPPLFCRGSPRENATPMPKRPPARIGRMGGK